MPLREDLLEPVAGDNPSGANLYYDKVFDQIKEARTEDVDSGPSGAWERTQKKADHVLVIKLAGEALCKRSKDLRLAGWLVESHLKREGIAILSPCLELLWKLQEAFWETFYPEIDDDGALDLRISSLEGTVNRIAALIKNAPITKSGYSVHQYQESRRVGYEDSADTSEKREARQDAIDHGELTGEEFDSAFGSTPKTFYAATESALEGALVLLGDIDRFHEEKYGDDYPSLNKLVSAVEEVKQVVVSLLNEKRKTDPDPVEDGDSVEPVEETDYSESEAEEPASSGEAVPAKRAASKGAGFSGVPTSPEQAYAAVLGCAEYLHTENPQSPVPYLVCSALRFGETRKEGAYPASDFAVAPATETRQILRRLTNEANWDELMKLSLRTLTEPCARAWLDLQRYIWRAARETGSNAIAVAVVSNVRGLLLDLPDLRSWMLDDDTPVANAETQQWIDAEILPPAPVAEAAEAVEAVESFAPVAAALPVDGNPPVPEIYDQAMEMLKRGKTGEAITLLVRDADLQPSGRKRFQRRVQVAQLCLVADQDPIAYPVLMELSNEIERRGLETWESGEMLAHPLSLLLKCLDRRKSSSEDKEVVFARLCRLDPQAALATRR